MRDEQHTSPESDLWNLANLTCESLLMADEIANRCCPEK